MASSSGTSSGILRQLTSPIGTLTHSACPPGYPPVKWLYPKNPASAWSALGFPPYLEYRTRIKVKECISRNSSSHSLHSSNASRDSHGPHQRRVVSPITEARQLYRCVEDKQKQRQKKGDSERSYISSSDGIHLSVTMNLLCLQNRHSPQAIWKEVTTLSPTYRVPSRIKMNS